MRIFLHDYSGHPFQVQLGRWLAGQDHTVLHCYSASMQTPHGALTLRAEDPSGFEIEAITLARPFQKYNLVRRRFQEIAYSKKLCALAERFGPDVVICGNASPEVQARLLDHSRRRQTPFVYWLQDIYSYAIERAARDRIPLLGGLIARYFHHVEFSALARSAAVVSITEDFGPILTKGGVAPERIHVIENWAPLEEVAPQPQDNPWTRAQGLQGRFLFLYAGTLGLKHNPSLLSSLAIAFRDDPEVAVVVASEGLGRTWLEDTKRREGLDNLILLDFQPYEDLPQMLAGASVLVTILEPYAGVLSVPSKVLTYLCAGRAILGAIPDENLAARRIREAEAGVCVSSEDEPAFLAAAGRLRSDSALRQRLAANGRRYAEEAFDITAIGQKFQSVLDAVSPDRQPDQRPLKGSSPTP